jgi:hypothetical protein
MNEITNDTITVFILLLKYFALGWVLIGVSTLIVNCLSISTQIQIRKNIITRRNDATTRRNHYKRTA